MMDAKFEKLERGLRELRIGMNSRFNAIEAELRYFHGVTGKLEGRIQAIEGL
jgi:hypothetical protein